MANRGGCRARLWAGRQRGGLSSGRSRRKRGECGRRYGIGGCFGGFENWKQGTTAGKHREKDEYHHQKATHAHIIKYIAVVE